MMKMILCNIFSTNHQHSLIFKLAFSYMINRGLETHPLFDLSIGHNKSLEINNISLYSLQ
jgi:hypothetical protein